MGSKPGWLKRQVRIAQIEQEEFREAKIRARARILEELGPAPVDHSYDFDEEYGLK